MSLNTKEFLIVGLASTLFGCLGDNNSTSILEEDSKAAKTNPKIETSCWDLPNDKKTEKCLQAEAEANTEPDATNTPYFIAKVASSVTYNVAVTSEYYNSWAYGCPTGTTDTVIGMDDEDSGNATAQFNFTAGWYMSNPPANTITRWCKLNATESQKFASLNGSSTVGFMVLKLGTNCPNGGYTIKRYFDNEDSNLPNSNYTNGVSIAPNISDDNTHMYFCYYPPLLFDNSMPVYQSSMPTLTGFNTYGVLSKNAGGYFGWHYSDDEDSNNANYLTIPAAVVNQARTQVNEIIEAGVNTKIHFSRIPQ